MKSTSFTMDSSVASVFTINSLFNYEVKVNSSKIEHESVFADAKHVEDLDTVGFLLMTHERHSPPGLGQLERVYENLGPVVLEV